MTAGTLAAGDGIAATGTMERVTPGPGLGYVTLIEVAQLYKTLQQKDDSLAADPFAPLSPDDRGRFEEQLQRFRDQIIRGQRHARYEWPVWIRGIRAFFGRRRR